MAPGRARPAALVTSRLTPSTGIRQPALFLEGTDSTPRALLYPSEGREPGAVFQLST